MSKKFKSKTSPSNDKEGCLCKNGKYSKRCCKGELLNQGVGKITNQSESVKNNQIKERVITNDRG